TQPGLGVDSDTGALARATIAPRASTSTASRALVPWSSATMSWGECSACMLRQRDLRADARAAPARAAHFELAAEGLDPVGKPAQARAERGVGAADAVVGHDHRGASVRAADAHLGVGGLRVLGHVRDRLGDD